MDNQPLSFEKILIVEEQSLAQSYMKRSLESLGFHLLFFAENAKVAKTLCSNEQFDLIICAFNLSKFQDGYQLYEELTLKKLIRSNTGFIFTSAETSGDLVHSVLELEPDDFLAKPFNTLELQKRIERVLKRKQALKEVYQLYDDENYTKLIKLINAELLKNKSHAPILLRLKGEALIQLQRYEEAKTFYKSVLNIQKFTWAKIGLVEVLMANNEYTLAQRMLTSMLQQSETRLMAYDLLGQLEIKLNNYPTAQEYLQQAAKIAPRNIARQTHLAHVAQLNNDYECHYYTQRDIAKYAKHSTHDSPDIYLNAARAGIDFALTTDQSGQISRISRQTAEYLNDLKKQFPNAEQQTQVDVLNARLHYLKEEHHKAKLLIEHLMTDEQPIGSIDGALDQAKALHELGLHSQSQALFNKILNHCEQYPQRSNNLQLQLIQQRQTECQELKMGPRELNNHAVKKFQQGNYQLALEAFSQAFKVMPHNTSIALNFLQCLYESQSRYGYSMSSQLAERCSNLLEKATLEGEQAERFAKLKRKSQELGMTHFA